MVSFALFLFQEKSMISQNANACEIFEQQVRTSNYIDLFAGRYWTASSIRSNKTENGISRSPTRRKPVFAQRRHIKIRTKLARTNDHERAFETNMKRDDVLSFDVQKRPLKISMYII